MLRLLARPFGGVAFWSSTFLALAADSLPDRPFLVGVERSGATMLRLMLSHHSRLAWSEEIAGFACDFGKSGTAWGYGWPTWSPSESAARPGAVPFDIEPTKSSGAT
jgi:hypothetical protein